MLCGSREAAAGESGTKRICEYIPEQTGELTVVRPGSARYSAFEAAICGKRKWYRDIIAFPVWEGVYFYQR